jgi:hypothetical protein
MEIRNSKIYKNLDGIHDDRLNRIPAYLVEGSREVIGVGSLATMHLIDGISNFLVKGVPRAFKSGSSKFRFSPLKS